MVGSEQQIVDIVPVENHDVNIGAFMNNLMHLQNLHDRERTKTFIQLLCNIIHVTCIILIMILFIIIATESYGKNFSFYFFINFYCFINRCFFAVIIFYATFLIVDFGEVIL